MYYSRIYVQFAKPCSSNRTRAYADTIKLPRITGRQWGEGKGPISASPYVQPPAVFAFTCPDGGGDERCVLLSHRWVLQKPDIQILSGLHQRISGFRKNPDLTSLPKIETTGNPSLCSVSLIQLSTWHCPHLLLSAMLRPRAAALLLPGARRCRSISFARTALSSKPATCRCCVRLMGQTDWQTDGHRIVFRPCSAYYAHTHSVKKRVQLSNRRWSALLNFLRRYWVH